MKAPNFFIVGAPKCGTTALSEYLRHHPNVFFSSQKELDFFNEDQGSEDITGLSTPTNLNEYLECFAGADERHLAVGEGSPHYLRSDVAVPNILDFNAEARLITMVRNPVDMIYSFHKHLVYIGRETCLDFEGAWRKQGERKQGRSIPENLLDRSKLFYSEIGMLGKQVERLFKVAPPEQIKIILFDDLAETPQEVYENVLTFLNLPSDDRTEFPNINPSKRVKSRRLQQMQWIVGLNVLRAKRTLGVQGRLNLLKSLKKLNTALTRFNTEYKARPALSPAFEAELRDFYKEDVELLSQLLGRDLSPWLRGQSIYEAR